MVDAMICLQKTYGLKSSKICKLGSNHKSCDYLHNYSENGALVCSE